MRFRVTHSSRTVTIATTEVTLAQNQRITHVKVLCHANHGFVSGAVTVRVILTQHVTDHTSGLHGLGIRTQTHFMHCIKNTALDRLLTVTDIRQSTSFHHRHRVLKVSVTCKMSQRQTLTVIARLHGLFFQAKLGRLFVNGLFNHFFNRFFDDFLNRLHRFGSNFCHRFRNGFRSFDRSFFLSHFGHLFGFFTKEVGRKQIVFFIHFVASIKYPLQLGRRCFPSRHDAWRLHHDPSTY